MIHAGVTRAAAWMQAAAATSGAACGSARAADDAAREKMRPGDYSYFRNWDVSEEGMAGGWQGENVISLGDGLYFGHPFGITSGEDIIKHLNGAREKDSNVTASLLDVRARIGAQILEHDQDPYG